MGDINDDDAEGWYLDPYGIHEQRWMSCGRPTNLVRDRGTEGKDEPPDKPLPGPLIPAPVASTRFGRDLARADDVDNSETSQDPRYFVQVAMDANAILNNPLTAGVLQSGEPLVATPLQRKLRQRARRERWSRRWHHLLGGSPPSEPMP